MDLSTTNLSFLSILFCIGIVFSLVFNALFLKWTRTLGTKNLAGDMERWSGSYKPAIGGITFYVIFLISFLLYSFFYNPSIDTLDLKHLGLLLAVSLGFFTGLADDAYNTVPWLKFVAQLCTGITLIAFDIRITFFESFWMNDAFTLFWTIAVMNSINMLDNMDGITTVTSIFILVQAAICALPLSIGNLFYTFICGGTVSALIGFLYFNWNPSKIFMGDTGSQMVGALLAAIGILFFWNNDSIAPTHHWVSNLSLVMVAFVIPIGDSLTVTINRIRRGDSPFKGGRDHTTHHMSYMGFSDQAVAITVLGVSCISTVLIYWIKELTGTPELWQFFLLLGYAGIVITGQYLTTVHPRARSTFKKQLQA